MNSDKGKGHHQPEDNPDNDGAKWNEEPMDQDMPMIERNGNSFKEENRHARTTLQTQTLAAEPHLCLETDVSLANFEMQDDSLIRTGQHHIWI